MHEGCGMAREKSTQLDQVTQFVNRVFELHKNEIMEELKRRAIKTEDERDRFIIATILAGYYELATNDFYKEKIEKAIKQGWGAEDTEVFYVAQEYVKFKLPNNLTFSVKIVPKDSEDLTKEEYFKVKEVYDELEHEYMKYKVQQLEEELAKKREELNEAYDRIRELEEKLEKCNTEEEDSDDDDY